MSKDVENLQERIALLSKTNSKKQLVEMIFSLETKLSISETAVKMLKEKEANLENNVILSKKNFEEIRLKIKEGELQTSKNDKLININSKLSSALENTINGTVSNLSSSNATLVAMLSSKENEVNSLREKIVLLEADLNTKNSSNEKV